MKRTIVAVMCVALCSCAHFTTKQTDERMEDGTTKITTKASAYTLFSSSSQLANFKATQTEKTQGAEVGSLNQQGGTNTVATLEALARLVGALPK